MPLTWGLPRTLHYGQPVNWAAPLNRDLLDWWLVLPLRQGGARWLNLASRNHGLLSGTGMIGSSGTGGWGGTTRRGGVGEVRFNGTDGQVVVTNPLYETLLATSSATVAGWLYFRTVARCAVFC